MKIYSRIVIDIESMAIIESDESEYDGPLVELKGGATTTNTQDTTYNARLAEIAERQQAMADEMFEYYKGGTGQYETREVTPATEGYWETRDITVGGGQTGKGDSLPSHTEQQKVWVPGDAAVTEQYWVPDEGSVGYQQMEQEQVKSNLSLIPIQTDLAKAEAEAQLGLLPAQTELAKTQATYQTDALKAKSPILQSFYAESGKGPQTEEKMGMATADVEQAFKSQEDERRRALQKYGIQASAMQYGKDLRAKAKALAGARTTARRTADDDYYKRLALAAAT